MADKVNYSELPTEAISRIGEVDRTEVIEAYYRCVLREDRRSMRITPVDINPPRTVAAWSKAEVLERIEKWTEMKADGNMYGAQSDSKLRGFAIVSGNRADGSAKLVALFVDAAYRGRGE